MIKHHYSTAPNVYVFSFIMTVDTFTMYLEDNYVLLNPEVDMYGYNLGSVNQECPRCISNSKRLQSDISHLADCTYYRQHIACTNDFNAPIYNAIELCYTPSSLLPIIQQMYHSTVQFVEVHPLVDKPPPPFKKKIMSRIQKTSYMLLPYKNIMTDENEIFYQWCTLQETIEYCTERKLLLVDKSPVLYQQFHQFIATVFNRVCSFISHSSTMERNAYFHNLIQVNFTQLATFQDFQHLSITPPLLTLLDYFEYVLHIPMFNQLLKLKFCLNAAVLVIDLQMSIESFVELCEMNQFCTTLVTEGDNEMYCLPCTNGELHVTEMENFTPIPL